MANTSGQNGPPEERYESLHTLQSPTAATTASRRGEVNGSYNQQDSRPPQRPGKLAKMVRMASELIVHGRTTSYNETRTTGKTNYGSTDSVPRVTMGDGNGADHDYDEDPFYEEAWGQWRLVLLTLGLAGAQLTWTVELGYVFHILHSTTVWQAC
jgi:hypothetical protein